MSEELKPAGEKFAPDWSRLEAAQESLREHMVLLKERDARIADLENELDRSREDYAHIVAGHESCKAECEDLKQRIAELERKLYAATNPPFTGRLDTWQAAAGIARRERDELQAEVERLRADAERLEYVYSNTKTTSNSLVTLELRLLNGEQPSMDEVRAAIDAARNAK